MFRQWAAHVRRECRRNQTSSIRQAPLSDSLTATSGSFRASRNPVLLSKKCYTQPAGHSSQKGGDTNTRYHPASDNDTIARDKQPHVSLQRTSEMGRLLKRQMEIWRESLHLHRQRIQGEAARHVATLSFKMNQLTGYEEVERLKEIVIARGEVYVSHGVVLKTCRERSSYITGRG